MEINVYIYIYIYICVCVCVCVYVCAYELATLSVVSKKTRALKMEATNSS